MLDNQNSQHLARLNNHKQPTINTKIILLSKQERYQHHRPLLFSNVHAWTILEWDLNRRILPIPLRSKSQTLLFINIILMIPADQQQKQQQSDLQFVCLDPKYTNHLVLVFAICGWNIPTQWIYYGPLASLYWRLDQGNIFLIGAENADIFQSGRARMALWDLQKPPSGNCLDSSYRQLLTK